MIDGRRILAVVPARGGSKGVPLKNLREIGGKSLVALVGKVIGASPWIDRAVVSTDHDGIADEAERAGVAAPFRRPQALSGDRIGDLDVLTNALEEMERIDGTTYDVVVMLQPTSPLRAPEDVERTVRHLLDGGLDSAWTVSPTDSKAHPLKQLTVEDGRLGYYDPRGAEIVARQQLSPVYHRNGIAYAMTRKCLLEHRSIMGPNAGAVVIEGEHVSIDTEWDLQLVEFYLRRRATGGGDG